MADYMRKILYLRKWEQGTQVPGAGYIRLERKKDFLSLSLRVDGDISKGSMVYGVYPVDGGWERLELGEFLQTSCSWETKIRLTCLPERECGDGIAGIYTGTAEQYWAGQEAGAQLSFEDFFEPELQAAEMYPFEDDEMQWCRQIEPEDLMYLSEPCWRVGNNSFLLQGYYNYRHLLYAGDGTRCYIGVPGQYHRREQYLARRFGFPRFKATKKKRVTIGDFGYWLQDVGGDGDDQR